MYICIYIYTYAYIYIHRYIRISQYTLQKPCIHSKEPYIHSIEPYTRPKSPVYTPKSPTYTQKSPIHTPKALYTLRYIRISQYTTYPTWGDNFQCCFKAQSSRETQTDIETETHQSWLKANPWDRWRETPKKLAPQYHATLQQLLHKFSKFSTLLNLLHKTDIQQSFEQFCNILLQDTFEPHYQRHTAATVTKEDTFFSSSTLKSAHYQISCIQKI